MFPGTKNRNEGTCGCSQKPERGHIRQNRPFSEPPFCFLEILILGGWGFHGMGLGPENARERCQCQSPCALAGSAKDHLTVGFCMELVLGPQFWWQARQGLRQNCSRADNPKQRCIPRKAREKEVWVSSAEIQTLAVDTRTAVWVSTPEKVRAPNISRNFGVVSAPALYTDPVPITVGDP